MAGSDYIKNFDGQHTAVWHRFGVNESLVLELLRDSIWTPEDSGCGDWRFIFAENEDQCKLAHRFCQYPELYGRPSVLSPKQRERFLVSERTLPSYIAVAVKKHSPPERWKDEHSRVCCLIQNFMMLAREHAMDVLWATGNYLSEPEIRSIFRIEANEQLLCILTVVPEAEYAAWQQS